MECWLAAGRMLAWGLGLRVKAATYACMSRERIMQARGLVGLDIPGPRRIMLAIRSPRGDDMTYRDDPQQAFEEAITQGRLTTLTAPRYMYMYTDVDGVDQFKHVDTRGYLPV